MKYNRSYSFIHILRTLRIYTENEKNVIIKEAVNNDTERTLSQQEPFKQEKIKKSSYSLCPLQDD